MKFEYKTVDVPMHRGRPTIEFTANQEAQKGWRPVTVITPTEAIPTYSILFERPTGMTDQRPRAWRGV